MSYHIKDFIADSTNIDKAELMIDSLDLLESVNYNLHLEFLENIFMTSDMMITADVISIIEATLLNSLSECCKEYGLYLNDIDPNLYRLDKVYVFSLTFFDLLSDESKDFEDDSLNEEDEIDKMIQYLSNRNTMDIYDISNLIEDVEIDLINTIEDNEVEAMDLEVKVNYMITQRLKRSNILDKSNIVKNIILTNDLGFDFDKMFLLLKNIIIEVSDLQQRVTELVTVLLASNLLNSEIKEKCDEVVDELGSEENEISQLRHLSKKMISEVLNE